MTIDLNNAPLVLLDDCRPSHKANPSYLFHSPDHLIVAKEASELHEAFEAIDAAVASGLHVAGWIAYETAGYFEPKLSSILDKQVDEPLIWMMATKHRDVLTSKDVDILLHNSARGNNKRATLQKGEAAQNEVEYGKALEAIHSYIRAGDVYQINHTLPIPIELEGSAITLYQNLRERQPVAYGAFINTGEHNILSLSPELFLAKQAHQLTARPMKGTAPRGRTKVEDRQIQQNLQQDEKSRAENLMIVDLIRNDLSRVSAPGSVSVPKLFDVEQYPTLHQMTTTVTATSKEGLTPTELLAAMFPCGSVTGAPKIRAMEVIQSLETNPRGVYCGTIGHFSPKTGHAEENWCLNVPIRTLVLDADQQGRMSVGSGIVADSDSANEYQECMLKAAFTEGQATNFCLIETMKLEGKLLANKASHLARMQTSAEYFDFPFDKAQVERQLEDHLTALSSEENVRRVRLLLDKSGATSITSELLPDTADTELTVIASSTRTDSTDPFLFHKTTNRPLYNAAINAALEQGHADVIFFNEKDELTEGAISSVFVEKDGVLYTPPVETGLLPSVCRHELLKTQSIEIKTLYKEDVATADALYIGNALRGLRRVTLVDDFWSYTDKPTT